MKMAAMTRTQAILARFDHAEYRLCRRFNRAAALPHVLMAMRAASRLGDGAVWYALLVALPVVYGAAAWRSVLVMAATGVAGLVLYKALKSTLVRERPFIRHPGIQLAMPPLDRYSFPSGHTLHAACFCTQACAHYPQLAWVLAPLASLIALSRVVLGLHYPSDVAAGALIGVALAACGLACA
jgi:undecaprenyl-diphosphatase